MSQSLRGMMAIIAVIFVLSFFFSPSMLQAQAKSQERLKEKIQELAKQGIPTTPEAMQAFYNDKPLTQNAADLFIQAFQNFQSTDDVLSTEECDLLPLIGMGDLPNSDVALSENQVVVIKKYLEKNQQTMNLLRQAVLIPDFRYPTDVTLGFSAMLPHLSQIRTAVQLFCLSTLVAIENKDADTAIESINVAVKLGKFLHREPFLISQLVANACYKILYPTLQRLLMNCRLSDEQLQKLSQILKMERSPKEFVRSYSSEIYAFWHEINKPDFNIDGIKFAQTMYLTYKVSGFWQDDVLFYLDFMAKNKELYSKPHIQWPGIIAAQEKYLRQIPSTYILSQLTLPSFRTLGTKELEFVCYIANYQAVVAVQRFQNKYEKLPDKLADVVPEFLDQEPIDVFVNRPIRYLPTDDGYKIYSVGYNQRDDNGQDKRGQDGEKLDIVFSLETTPEE